MEYEAFPGNWALILGASSGFGAATAVQLARKGMNVFGVHLDRSTTLANAHEVMAEIEKTGQRAMFFNVNAVNQAKRTEVLDQISACLFESDPPGKVMAFLHSLAFGSLAEFIANQPKDAIKQSQVDMTLEVMANSLVYWTQDLVYRGLLGAGARVFTMTSSGSHRVWLGYGAVSGAKAALEAYVRQLAVELAPRGITVNAVRAGVTDTKSSRAIPGFDKMSQEASTKNPMGRMTRPEDVAATIGALCVPDAYWLTGSVLGVDGGEDNIG